MQNKDYFTFAHVTDIHLSPNYKSLTNKRFHTFVHDFLPELQPDCVVATGDLSNSISLKGHTLPNEKEWKFYESTLRESNYFDPKKWLDIRGNHDAWDNTSEEKNYYKKYSVYGFYNRGLIYEEIYDYKNEKIRFISIDASYAPFKTFSGILNTIELDQLEDLLTRNNDYLCTILLSHYPLYTMDNRVKSSSGLSFYDLIHIYRPSLFLNGHIHSILGRNASMIHSCDTVEIQTPQFKRIGLFRVFTIHNNQLFWKTYSIKQFNQKPFLFICNPNNCITLKTPKANSLCTIDSHLFIYTIFNKHIKNISIPIQDVKKDSDEILPITDHYILFKYNSIDISTIPYYLRPLVLYEKPNNQFLSSFKKSKEIKAIDVSIKQTTNDIDIKEQNENTINSNDSNENKNTVLKNDRISKIEKESVSKQYTTYKQPHEDNTIDIYYSPWSFYKVYMSLYTVVARTVMHINISMVINKVPYVLAILLAFLYTISYSYSKKTLAIIEAERMVLGKPVLVLHETYHVYNIIIQYCQTFIKHYIPCLVEPFDSISLQIPSYLPSITQRYRIYSDLYYSFEHIPSYFRGLLSKWLLISSDFYVYISLMIGIITYLFCPQRIIKANGQRYWTSLWGFTNIKTNKRYDCLDHPLYSTLWFILQNIVLLTYLFLFYAIPIPHYMNIYFKIVIRSIIKVILFIFMLLMSRPGKRIRSLLESPEFFFSFTDDIRPTLFFLLMIREVIMA